MFPCSLFRLSQLIMFTTAAPATRFTDEEKNIRTSISIPLLRMLCNICCCYGSNILISTRNHLKNGLHIHNSVTGTIARNFSKLRVAIMIFCEQPLRQLLLFRKALLAPLACDQLIIMSILFILVLCRRFFVQTIRFFCRREVSAELFHSNYIASDIIVDGYSILLREKN